MNRELNGRHVALMFVGAFSVIIAVNVTMAFFAVSTFPGLEVKNSYVASQQFEARRSAQQALGWKAAASYENGEVLLGFTGPDGRAVTPQNLTVLIGRTTAAQDDVTPEFQTANGQFRAPIELQRGKWMMRVEARAADGTLFQQRLELRVQG